MEATNSAENKLEQRKTTQNLGVYLKNKHNKLVQLTSSSVYSGI